MFRNIIHHHTHLLLTSGSTWACADRLLYLMREDEEGGTKKGDFLGACFLRLLRTQKPFTCENHHKWFGPASGVIIKCFCFPEPPWITFTPFWSLIVSHYCYISILFFFFFYLSDPQRSHISVYHLISGVCHVPCSVE